MWLAAARTLDRVAASGLRMMLDLYHAQIGEGNLIELLRRPVRWLARSRWPTSRGVVSPGAGRSTTPAIAAALEELGYRGTVGLEAWASGDGERALARFGAAFTSPEPSEPGGAGP